MDLISNGLSLIPTSHSTGSSSGASMSMPITPIHVPVSDHDVLYPPIDFPSGSGFTPDLGSLNHLEEDGAWPGQDMDATPTLGSNGGEKSLAALEREFVNPDA